MEKMEDALIRYLMEGKTQTEIAKLLKQQGIKPNSLSAIEKMLKAMREKHNAGTMFHLGAILTIKKYIRKS